MKKSILVVGSGGREHAIGWKLSQSPQVGNLFFAPGNGGTSALGENVPIKAEDISGLLSWAKEHKPDLTIVGPEAPLSEGIADLFQKENLYIFGPSEKAAEIETSKVYAKRFMETHNIPTARYAVFDSSEKAHIYIDGLKYPVVVKASGLAAGKGVLVPKNNAEANEAIERILVKKEFGIAGSKIVIEEQLKGEEVSVLAFTDGKTIVSLPPTQDHKRLLDRDQGPNTGGMGAYTPTPFCSSSQLRQIEETILKPTVLGLANENRLFKGVLYAGVMLTQDGPKVLEFNCRFGDPEIQVILPLLDTDLVEIIEACINGTLDKLEVKWKKETAVVVVLASGGYPGEYAKGLPISGIGRINGFANVHVFHAGTTITNGKLVTSGGRVLAVTAVSSNLHQALENAYYGAKRIVFADKVFRTDIGKRALRYDK